MRCLKCGAENPDKASFCVECASPFPRRCASCGTENPPTAKFCFRCAQRLDKSESEFRSIGQSAASPVSLAQRPTDGERKTATALFADIKGSTELERDLDSEEARAIVDPVLHLMMAAVHRYDGYVAHLSGPVRRYTTPRCTA